jgi:multiple sugar transport system permease protein
MTTHSTATGRFKLGMRAREEIAGYLFILPWLLGFLVFTGGAMIYSLYLSFYDADFLSKFEFVGLANYTQMLLSDELWPKAIGNTAYYAFIAVPLMTTMARS